MWHSGEPSRFATSGWGGLASRPGSRRLRYCGSDGPLHPGRNRERVPGRLGRLRDPPRRSRRAACQAAGSAVDARPLPPGYAMLDLARLRRRGPLRPLVRQLRASGRARRANARLRRPQARPDRAAGRPSDLEGRGRARGGRPPRAARRDRRPPRRGARPERPTLADRLGGLPARCRLAGARLPAGWDVL